MTLFFDVFKLEAEAKDSDKRFMDIFEDYYNRKTYNKYQKIKYGSIKGNSWILNPTPLFNCNEDIAYIVQYIKLAGRRDYFLYKNYNQISLDCSFFNNLFIDNIRKNPLLTLSNNHINFKFEKLYLDSKKLK